MAVKKKSKNIERYRAMRKKFDLYGSAWHMKPETHISPRGVGIKIFGRGRDVSKPVTSVKGIVTKVYKMRSTDDKHIHRRYTLTKELIKEGAPINDPKRIYTINDKKGLRIVWKEKDLGKNIETLLRDAKIRNDMFEVGRLNMMYELAMGDLSSAMVKSNIDIQDVGKDHAYLTKKGKIMFSDLDLSKKVRKKRKIKT